MKSHLIVKLHRRVRGPQGTPFWRTFIRDKRRAVESFHPEFDQILAGHALPFWVTTEYEPAEAVWSAEEAAAGLDRIYRIVLQRDGDLPPGLVERVRLIPEFEYVRPIHVEAPRLPQPSLQTSVHSFLDRSRESIGLREAHGMGMGDPRIKVAVLDTGVDLAHPEIRDSIKERADFVHLEGLDTTPFIGDVTGYDLDPSDEVGHGTHVAGIIAAKGLRMPSGVASGCSLVAVRTLATMRTGNGLAGAGMVDNINVAIKYCVDVGCHVINASLGIKHSGGGLPHDEVVRYAVARGVTVVAASGNDGTAEKYYPGALPDVLAVGATDANGDVAAFSSYGAAVSLVAPGTDVMSCYAGGRYELASGTSQASPFVAGAVALLKSQALARGMTLGDADVKAILRHTADRDDAAMRTPRRGHGRLNVLDACRLLSHTLDDHRHRAAA